MAICPNCHVEDKPFFAPKCYSCNTRVGFLEQCFFQLLFLTVAIGGFFFGLWFLKLIVIG